MAFPENAFSCPRESSLPESMDGHEGLLWYAIREHLYSL
jgi:hypothetical protein